MKLMEEPFWKEKMSYILERMDEAYHLSPSGSFWERWIPGVCEHWKIRCTHGDEILGCKMRRRVCMICGRALKGDLPFVCFFTGEIHSHFRIPRGEADA